MSIPQPIQESFDQIKKEASAGGWNARLDETSGSFFATLWCHINRPQKNRNRGVKSDTKIDKRVINTSENQHLNCEESIRSKSPRGRGSDRPDGRSPSARAVVSPTAGSTGTDFGGLPTVRAMGTGEARHVVGFDTEFTYADCEDEDGNRERIIDSYQFATLDPSDPEQMYQICILPLNKERIYIGDALGIVSEIAGLERLVPGLDPRGRSRREFWKTDHRKSYEQLFKLGAEHLVLAGHFQNADLTAFKSSPNDRHADPLRRVTSAGGGLTSLKPARFVRKLGSGSSQRWLPFSVVIRDTMSQTSPNHKSLAAMGEVCGVPKLDVGDQIEDMSSMRENNLVDFLAYGINDAVIVLEYLSSLWGENITPPVTVSSGGARALKAGICEYWGIDPQSDGAAFRADFQGLVKIRKGEVDDQSDHLAYYTARQLAPIDGDANQSHTAWKHSYHGGLNACLAVGFFPGLTFDHDIQSAYPSAMASIFDVDYQNGCIETVIKDRELTLDDFDLGALTPLVAFVSWEFPADVTAPTLPVVVGDSLIFPRTSTGSGAKQGEGMGAFTGFEGSWCAAPELYLALKLGAKIKCQIGYKMRLREAPQGSNDPYSRSLRAAVKQMVVDRAVAKQKYGKGSLAELLIKVATNSCYGKLAQDVDEQNGWDAWREEMEAVGGSAVTSPYHASMITSLVRSLLLAVANSVDILSVTTDGFISTVLDIESLPCFGIAEIFRDSREAITGDKTVWEVKHKQSDLLNLSTRGNVSLDPGGVLAKAGLKTPDGIEKGSYEERQWFRETALSREGKIPNEYTSFPSFKELSRSVDRVDFAPVHRCPLVSTVDFDLKRKPIYETLQPAIVDGYEIACFETEPWDSVGEYERGKLIGAHIQSFRPGTSGENRPTGCLRTMGDWETWFVRFNAHERRIRTADSALLTDIVTAHKSGLFNVPVLNDKRLRLNQKLDWLNRLGLGSFSRSQWDNLSKQDRLNKAADGLDIQRVKDFIDSLDADVAKASA